MTTTRKPVTFTIPPGSIPTHCKSCNAVIFWIKTTAGKKMPVDPHGNSHFATCPDADEHRKPRT